MKIRPIDANALRQALHDAGGCGAASDTWADGWDKAITEAIRLLDEAPTLTQPNEALTLISMDDELPPDNERVLVYRPCMIDADVGPYSVQWGWAAKKDGTYWARLPGLTPLEGEEDELNG